MNAVMEFVQALNLKRSDIIHEYAMIVVEEEGTFGSSRETQFFHKYVIKLLNSGLNRSKIATKIQSISKPFKHVLMISPTKPSNPYYKKFCELVIERTQKDFHVPIHNLIKPQVPIYASLAYDAVIVYARALNRTLSQGGHIRNTSHVMANIFNQTYESILGFMDHIDMDGNAEGNYTLEILDSRKLQEPFNLVYSSFMPQMEAIGIFRKIQGLELPKLTVSREKLSFYNVRDELKCGFNNEKCGLDPLIVAAISVVFLILSALFYILLRHFRYEIKLESKLWKVDFREVIVLNIKKDQTNQDVKNAIAVSIIFFKF